MGENHNHSESKINSLIGDYMKEMKEEFIKTISLEQFGQSFEIEDSNVDLTEALREEVLMHFPNYPKCDEADDPHTCKIEERYLSVDKDPDNSVDEAPESTSDNQWGALDEFKKFKD